MTEITIDTATTNQTEHAISISSTGLPPPPKTQIRREQHYWGLKKHTNLEYSGRSVCFRQCDRGIKRVNVVNESFCHLRHPLLSSSTSSSTSTITELLSGSHQREVSSFYYLVACLFQHILGEKQCCSARTACNSEDNEHESWGTPDTSNTFPQPGKIFEHDAAVMAAIECYRLDSADGMHEDRQQCYSHIHNPSSYIITL